MTPEEEERLLKVRVAFQALLAWVVNIYSETFGLVFA